MFTLGIKQSEKVDLCGPIKSYIETAYNTQLATQAHPIIFKLQQAREELIQYPNYRHDSTAMRRFLDTAKTYISMWSVLSQSFTFGMEKVLLLLNSFREV